MSKILTIIMTVCVNSGSVCEISNNNAVHNVAMSVSKINDIPHHAQIAAQLKGDTSMTSLHSACSKSDTESNVIIELQDDTSSNLAKQKSYDASMLASMFINACDELFILKYESWCNIHRLIYPVVFCGSLKICNYTIRESQAIYLEHNKSAAIFTVYSLLTMFAFNIVFFINMNYVNNWVKLLNITSIPWFIALWRIAFSIACSQIYNIYKLLVNVFESRVIDTSHL